MRKKPLFNTVLTVVVATLLIGAMAFRLPAVRSYLKNRAYANAPLSPPKPYAGCAHTLLLIDDAKNQWAVEYHKTTNDPPPTLNDLRPYIGRGSNGVMPECPCGGAYIPGRLDEPARDTLSPQDHTYERMAAHEAKRQNQ
jgi:hypothetical protein